MSTKMSIFAETIILGGTIHNETAARITGDKVGAENFAKWQVAMNTCLEKFWKYKKAVDDIAHGKAADVKAAKTEAYDAFGVILDMIGLVNGHPIVKDEDLFQEFAKYAVRETTELIGEAEFVRTQLANVRAELKNTAGCNPEWLEAKLKEEEELDEKLKALKKLPGSGKPLDKPVSINTFRKKFERKIAKIVSEQTMKTWEELQAEEEARKEARKAARKAAKAAKKAAAKA